MNIVPTIDGTVLEVPVRSSDQNGTCKSLRLHDKCVAIKAFLVHFWQRATMVISEKVVWRVSEHFCALHDTERHLGHLVKTDKWHAYDATHINSQEDGMLYVGGFSDLEAAKAAVEASIASRHQCAAEIPAWIF